MNPAAMIQMAAAVGGAGLHKGNAVEPGVKRPPTMQEILEYLASHHDQAFSVAEICARFDADPAAIHPKLLRNANRKDTHIARSWKFTENGSYRHRAYQIKPEFVEAVLGVVV